MQHNSVNPYIVALNTEMFQNSTVPPGLERLQQIYSEKDHESPITVKFVPAYKYKIYSKYADSDSDSEDAIKRKPSKRDQVGVKNYKKFVQTYKVCRPLWKRGFGRREAYMDPNPNEYIAMGINKDKKVVACALIEFVSSSQVGTIGNPISKETKVAWISAITSSEERRGHAQKLISKIKEFAKSARCCACALDVDTLQLCKHYLEYPSSPDRRDENASDADLAKKAERTTLGLLRLYYKTGFIYQLQWSTRTRKPIYHFFNDDPYFLFSNLDSDHGYRMICWLSHEKPNPMFRLKNIKRKNLLDDVQNNFELTPADYAYHAEEFVWAEERLRYDHGKKLRLSQEEIGPKPSMNDYQDAMGRFVLPDGVERGYEKVLLQAVDEWHRRQEEQLWEKVHLLGNFDLWKEEQTKRSYKDKVTGKYKQMDLEKSEKFNAFIRSLPDVSDSDDDPF